ncbi:MAG: indolepyruvate oxidoreductase subunit beta [Deltaproteobacteria bacterium]|nr:indolepyruvate oxidoreductase subunit beta [Deltaproteobacteria bacterium]
MEPVNIVICGLGGQGILFMSKVLAHTALEKGLDVIGAETHGMAQRGGSVISHLRLGDLESSLVRAGSAHLLFSLEVNEAYRNLSYLARGGRMYVDADGDSFPRDEVKAFLDGKDVLYRNLPASRVAIELGFPLSSNLALLGYFSSFGEGPLFHDELRQTIEKISPERFRENNLKVFDAGSRWGKERMER